MRVLQLTNLPIEAFVRILTHAFNRGMRKLGIC